MANDRIRELQLVVDGERTSWVVMLATIRRETDRTIRDDYERQLEGIRRRFNDAVNALNAEERRVNGQ